MDDQLDQAARDYHRFSQPGHISVMPAKAMTNRRDLAMAYSPGIAAACMSIAGGQQSCPVTTHPAATS
jgi:malate dehydrogenase (oxaloacetate-decarboxylating)(NADP+)